MNLRWSFLRNDRDVPDSDRDEANKEDKNDSADRASIKGVLEREMSAIMNDEIKGAAQELVEAQRKEIRFVVEACKQVIAEVLEEEKKSINEKKETIRKIIISSNQF
jgi:hypothetical protein